MSVNITTFSYLFEYSKRSLHLASEWHRLAAGGGADRGDKKVSVVGRHAHTY